jgi:uncharacterized membrane protein YqjE
MRAADPPKSAGEMMTDVVGHVSSLVRKEADLARAEIAESVTKAGASIAAMAVALVLAIVGLNVVATGLVTFVVLAGLPLHWATLVVGAGLLLIALAIFFSAKAALQQVNFVPTRAARNVQRDAAAIKDSFNDK